MTASEPFRVITLSVTAMSSSATPSNFLIFGLYPAMVSLSPLGVGLNSMPAYIPSVFSLKMTRSISSR